MTDSPQNDVFIEKELACTFGQFARSSSKSKSFKGLRQIHPYPFACSKEEEVNFKKRLISSEADQPFSLIGILFRNKMHLTR